jgi:HK97 family phage prohead protease
MTQITKRSITTKTKTRNSRTTVIASTATPDRYNDIVAGGDAWDLKSYEANPVIQFAHRYDTLPIGRATKLTTDEDGSLIATIEWDTANELGRQVAESFDRGFMSAVSVGFQPSNATERRKLPTDHPAHGDTGMYFSGPNRLLEISAVPVPANGEALALRSADGTTARSVLNVEETEDTYVVTYAKYKPDEADEADDEDAEDVEEMAVDDEDADQDDQDDEAEGYADDEDAEDETEAIGDEDEDAPPPADDEDDDEDDEDDEDEDAAKALRPLVRQVLLELLGHDPDIRRALSSRPRTNTRPRAEALANLFGIDN